METFKLDQDINVLYITATSFPEGIMAAHEKLHSIIPFTTDRRYFGLSRPEQGGDIIYRAAAEELEKGEVEKYHLEKLTIKKGNYISAVVHDYMKNPLSLQTTFEELLSDPNIDHEGYCVEWYLSKDDV